MGSPKPGAFGSIGERWMRVMVRDGVAAATIVAMVLSVGCGGADLAVSACTPGQTTSCSCAGGKSGILTCQAGGTYAACSCTQPDAGGGADAPDVMSVDASTDAPMTVDVFAVPMDVPPICPPLQTPCLDQCVSFQSDPMNCGACGNVCASGSRCVAGACELDACAATASTRCGRELLTEWSRPSGSSSCSPAFVARDFSTIAATTALSSCGEAVDLAGAGANAERPLRAVVSRCSPPAPFTITMVGRLPTNYQRSLGFELRWTSGESVTLNRWVWNTPGESATDVTVSTSSGALVNYMRSSADTGRARGDRPWGWYIGNDAGWWRMTVTVDPAADTVSATFTQPSQGSTEYTVLYSTPIPDVPPPSLKLITAGPCDGGGLSGQLLSLTASPPLWR